jgi:hypothetical protein
LKNLQKIDYFQDIGDDALHDIVYSLQTAQFSQGDVLQEPGANATTLFFLQDGVIEISTKIENEHEFVLEKLFRGSVINYRTFFMEDSGKVFYRFGRKSICSTLDLGTINDILLKHRELKNKFLKYKQKTILSQKTFPLDYIMKLPGHLRDPSVDLEARARAFRLENILKNIVVQRLTDIRELKAKPSLKDMINDYLKRKADKDERARVRIKQQVLQIYEEKTYEQFEEKDPNFNKIIIHIERLLKITTAQTLAIDSLERKIMNLSKKNGGQSELLVPQADG